MSTRTVSTFICDRCGAEAEGMKLPSSWSSVRVVHNEGGYYQDLCSTCFANFERFLKGER